MCGSHVRPANRLCIPSLVGGCHELGGADAGLDPRRGGGGWGGATAPETPTPERIPLCTAPQRRRTRGRARPTWPWLARKAANSVSAKTCCTFSMRSSSACLAAMTSAAGRRAAATAPAAESARALPAPLPNVPESTARGDAHSVRVARCASTGRRASTRRPQRRRRLQRLR